MLFDGTIQVVGLDVQANEGERAVLIALTIATPFPGPQGVGLLPMATLRFGIDRDGAMKFADELKDKAEMVKPVSDLTIATNLENVRDIESAQKRFKGEE